MHENRATIPLDLAAEVTRLALNAGIHRVSVADVFVYGPTTRRKLVSVEMSTPKAKAFVNALLSSPDLASVDYTITSRELRVILDTELVAKLTQPMIEPFPESLAVVPRHARLLGTRRGRRCVACQRYH